MKSILLLAIPAIVATAPMLYASGAPAPQNPTYYQREIDETYDIDQDAVIRITHSLGDVSIEVWDRNEVHVQGRIEARGEKAREIGAQIKIRVDGRSPLVLETVYPKGEWRNVSYGARLRVRVPRGHALEASNSFGDLKLEGVHGDVTARVGSGKLQVKGAHGTLKLTGSFGSIRVENSRGSTTISGGSTSVDVRNLLDGDLEVQNTFGAVRLEKIQGDVRIENNSGDVIVREVAGSINAQGTFGTHRYTNIQGNLTVKTKSVTITAEHIGGMAHLETAFANVSLQDCSQDACLITQNGQARGPPVLRAGGPAPASRSRFPGLAVNGHIPMRGP